MGQPWSACGRPRRASADCMSPLSVKRLRRCAAARDAHWAKVVEALRELVYVCERRDEAEDRIGTRDYQAAMKAARAALEEQPCPVT